MTTTKVYVIKSEDQVYRLPPDEWLIILLQNRRIIDEKRRSKFPRIPGEHDIVDIEAPGVATVEYAHSFNTVRHVHVEGFTSVDWANERENFSMQFQKGRMKCPTCDVSCNHYWIRYDEDRHTRWAICEKGHKWNPPMR